MHYLLRHELEALKLAAAFETSIWLGIGLCPRGIGGNEAMSEN